MLFSGFFFGGFPFRFSALMGYVINFDCGTPWIFYCSFIGHVRITKAKVSLSTAQSNERISCSSLLPMLSTCTFTFSVSVSMHYKSLVVRKPVLGGPTRPHTNQAVQLPKMASGLKFRI